MDSRHLSRLKEEQQIAIEETKDRIKQCEQFRSDYKALESRLETLPDSVTHDIMVPFGKFAFMPGQIVHSNEILVLLGDNWFAERSAKQAAAIASRRVQELDTKMAAMTSQLDLLQPRLAYTEDIQAQERNDVKEIREDYDEETEKRWDEQHKKNVKKHKKEQRLKVSSPAPPVVVHQPLSPGMPDDEANMWARLEELERQEEQEEHGDQIEGEKGAQTKTSFDTNFTEKRVSFVGNDSQNRPTEEEDDDSDDDDDSYEDCTDEESEEEEESGDHNVEQPRRSSKARTILFSHSKTSAILPHQVSSSGDASITSPGDIYKLYSPRSILKHAQHDSPPASGTRGVAHTGPAHRGLGLSTNKEEDNSYNNNSYTSVGSEPSHHTSSSYDVAANAKKAFSGLIIERALTPAPTLTPALTHGSTRPTTQQGDPSTHQGDPPRRVSKFKAKRMEQH